VLAGRLFGEKHCKQYGAISHDVDDRMVLAAKFNIT
jgi:hypothetical protein